VLFWVQCKIWVLKQPLSDSRGFTSDAFLLF